MGLGVGIFLTAVGAILAFAVSKTVSGVDIHAIGWILMIVGIIGVVLSMIFWPSWAGPGYWTHRPAATAVGGRRAAGAAGILGRKRSGERRGGRKAPAAWPASGSSNVNVEP